MKRVYTLIAVGVMTAASFATETAKTPKPMKVDLGKVTVANDKDQFSYAAGRDLGNSIVNFKDEINLQALFAGIESSITGRTPLMTDSASQATIRATIERVQKQQAEKQEALKIANKDAGIAFLAQNKLRPEVKTTASGLQYEILKDSTGFEMVGVGDFPSGSDEVTVNYIGTTIDGKEFDSSIKRGEAATFNLDRVIPGWTEGIQLMKTGGHFKLYIPYELAYGENGAGPDILPYSTLIFDVELIGVTKQMAEEPATK